MYIKNILEADIIKPLFHMSFIVEDCILSKTSIW